MTSTPAILARHPRLSSNLSPSSPPSSMLAQRGGAASQAPDPGPGLPAILRTEVLDALCEEEHVVARLAAHMPEEHRGSQEALQELVHSA